MYFYEVLQSIMDEKNLSIPDVARLSGLTDSTVRSMISRKNKTIALEVAFKLSKGLNVSLEQLNGEPINKNNDTPEIKVVDEQKIQLINMFDKLNKIGKQEAVKRVEELTYINKYTSSEIEGKILA